MDHAYKGYKIVRQYVGPCGWNIVSPDGVCSKGMTGFRSIASAKDWINWNIQWNEIEEFENGLQWLD